jgi:xanthosine utilization system XapX-like protein
MINKDQLPGGPSTSWFTRFRVRVKLSQNDYFDCAHWGSSLHGICISGALASSPPRKAGAERAIHWARHIRRLFRLQVTAVGTFAVFFGALGSIFAALHWIASFSPVLLALPVILGVFLGVYAVSYVRDELKSRPAYIANNPHGWWP